MIRVVKIGGSLLDMRPLPSLLRAWLAAQSPAHHVLIVGGGPLAEQVRTWHAAIPIDDVASHWMCVDLLHVTSQLLHAWLPGTALVEDVGSLSRRVATPGVTVFSPTAWLRRSEPELPGTPLPADWKTTSDSIAGRLAVALEAEELVLLKSCLPQSCVELTYSDLAAMGYIDPVLAEMSAALPPARLVNFRASPPAEVPLDKPGDRLST